MSAGPKSILNHLSTIEVSCKGQVYKMRLICELNVHSLEKLPLDMLSHVRYKSTNLDVYAHDDDQVHVELFDDVGFLFDEGKGKMIWNIRRVHKIVKDAGENKNLGGLCLKCFSY